MNQPTGIDPSQAAVGSSMHAFIGLGNPGVRFDGTRHNAGFEVIDKWLHDLNLVLSPVGSQFHSVVAKIDNYAVALIKPMTYMNRSGLAVLEAIGHFDLDLARIVIVCDDVNLDFGTLRIRASGSHGGHRGLESIIDTLGTGAFPRQRIGIDLPQRGNGLVDYVLEPFTKEEATELPFVYERACSQLEVFLAKGCEQAASRYNGSAILN